MYTFSSGVNAIQEWYKLHYMNIMAQVPLEKRIDMSYSAQELLVTCFFDGMSCDARCVLQCQVWRRGCSPCSEHRAPRMSSSSAVGLGRERLSSHCPCPLGNNVHGSLAPVSEESARGTGSEYPEARSVSHQDRIIDGVRPTLCMTITHTNN